MDSAFKGKRKFPAYTLAELESAVANGRGTQEIIDEIKARKEGSSVAFVVPQL